ncbi:MAG: hypothetical protein ABGX43_06015, partial [Nitrospinaceae bacterium]
GSQLNRQKNRLLICLFFGLIIYGKKNLSGRFFTRPRYCFFLNNTIYIKCVRKSIPPSMDSPGSTGFP